MRKSIIGDEEVEAGLLRKLAAQGSPGRDLGRRETEGDELSEGRNCKALGSVSPNSS